MTRRTHNPPAPSPSSHMNHVRALHARRTRAIRARELRRQFGLQRGESGGVTIAEQVANGLGLLGVEAAGGVDGGSIVVRKRKRRVEGWWEGLRFDGVDDVDVERDALVGGVVVRERCVVCRSLLGLREVLTRVRRARLALSLGRGKAERVGRLSAWGVASAVVLLFAVKGEIFVRGAWRDEVHWCCEWMMGDLDEEFPIDSFVVDLPLKLLKGCSVRVFGRGAFAVRVDDTKAIKLMKVGGEVSKEPKVPVLRAGAGRAGYARRVKQRTFYSKYCQWRPYVAVVAVGQRPHFAKGGSGYGASGTVVYVD
eukprot:GFKZ01010691.1.p1 GENE.GFKZ01010691.1~~GFKZ01010691.1.p1  ORF type:complete len:310 (-),score=47.14 GFKZ01010691.1:82-1011(-)